MFSASKIEVVNNAPFWFCVNVEFVADWPYNVPATHFSGWISASAPATGFSTITSYFNTIDSRDMSTDSSVSAAFWSVISENQVEYTNQQVMKFVACGAKTDDVDASEIKFNAKILMVIDWKPPPIPSPSFAGFQLGKFGNITDCYPTVDPEVLQWDTILFGDVASATQAVLGGRIAAQGNIIVNHIYSNVGSDVSSCLEPCNGNYRHDTFLVAGGAIYFEKNSPGICGGFIQGAEKINSESQLVVANGCPKTTGSTPVSFGTIKSSLSAYSLALSKKEPNVAAGFAINSIAGGSVMLAFVPEYKDYVIFVPGDFVTSKGIFKLYVLHSQYISTAKSITFNIDGSLVDLSIDLTQYFKDQSSKIIFNFYEATRVQFLKGVYYGSVLAPNADVFIKGGATIFGALYAKSLTVQAGSLRTAPRWIGFTSYAGKCISCENGFYGPQCQACSCKYNQICSDGVLGNGQCTCMPNFDSACVECKPGFFGKYCNNSCTSTCMANGVCNSGLNGNGSCSNCKSPFNGTQCENCIYGYWGKSCTNQCQTACIEKGVCDSGVNGTGLCLSCKSPWGNGPAKLCEECDNGHYGATCQFSCTSTCVKHGTCSSGTKGTGKCLSCRSLYIGTECEECIRGVYGPDCLSNCTQSCLTYGKCNDGASGDGSCSSCSSITTGNQCQKCVTTGNYGSSCSLKCKESCMTNGFCSDGPLGTGRCLRCKSGWSGTQCEKSSSYAKLSYSLLILSIIISIFI
jgi:choice-of-anchor A domain-containing protein